MRTDSGFLVFSFFNVSSGSGGPPSFVGEKLKTLNYLSWRREFEDFLSACADGAQLLECLEEDLAEGASAAKRARDRKVLALIRNACSREVRVHVDDCATAASAWKALSELISSHCTTNVHAIEKAFAQLRKKPSESVVGFIARVRQHRDLLKLAGVNRSEASVIHVILDGLPSAYDHIRDNYLYGTDSRALNSVSIMDVMSRLQIKEQPLLNSDSRPNVPANSTTSTPPPPVQNAPPASVKHCTYCQKKGHVERHCFKRKRDEARKNAQSGNSSNSGPSAGPSRALTVVPVSSIQTSHAEDFLSSCASYDPAMCVVDSGAGQHMCADLSLFTSFQESRFEVAFADNSTGPVYGTGSVEVDFFGFPAVMHNVAYVPGLAQNLMSVPATNKHGVSVSFGDDVAKFYFPQGDVFSSPLGPDSVYKLYCRHALSKRKGGASKDASAPDESQKKTEPEHTPCLSSASNPVDINLWHRRFAHLSTDSVVSLQKNNFVSGMGDKPLDAHSHPCEVCVSAKAKRKPFPVSESRAEQPLELLHMDLIGPMPASHSGVRYVMPILDDHTRYSAVLLLKKRSDATDALISHIREWESLLSHKVKRIRSDGGGEFTSNALKEFCADNGIHHEFSTPYCPSQNGRAERLNAVLLERAVAMLAETDLPTMLWPEAILHASYIRNRSPSLRSRTPYENLFGEVPDVSDLKVWGCVAHVYVDKDHREDKLSKHTKKGRFVGFRDDMKGYSVMFPDGTTTTSRHVDFFESLTRNPESVPLFRSDPESGSRFFDDSLEITDILTELLTSGVPHTDQVVESTSVSPALCALRASVPQLVIPKGLSQAKNSSAWCFWEAACLDELASI